MTFLLLLAALSAGTANPFQSGLNAELNKRLATPIWTTAFVYLTGFLGVLLLQAVFRYPLPTTRLATIPWCAWLGGLVSISSTIIGLTIAQRLGSTLFTGASITASPALLAGCALLVAGVWLIAKF